MERELSKIIVFAGTGYIGRHIVRASVSIGHPTYVYSRPLDQNCTPSKVQIHEEFKSMGVTIVQRFIPSDFGCNEERISGLPPFQALLDSKKKIRQAIEAAQIPHTYVSSTCFGTYFLNFMFKGPHVNSDKELKIYGSGEAKAVFTSEKDIGYYTMKVATDPRTKNRSILCRPPRNVMSQLEVAFLWEAKTGLSCKKVHISDQDLVKYSQTLPHPENVRAAILHSIFVNGDINVELRDDDMEVWQLYLDFNYETVEDIIDGLLNNPPEFEYIAL